MVGRAVLPHCGREVEARALKSHCWPNTPILGNLYSKPNIRKNLFDRTLTPGLQQGRHMPSGRVCQHPGGFREIALAGIIKGGVAHAVAGGLLRTGAEQVFYDSGMPATGREH